MNILVVLLSTFAITIAFLLLRKGRRVMGKGKRSMAIIIDNRFEPDNEGGGVYYPIVKFTTDKNETITKELDWGSDPPRKVGKRLNIAYDPEKPDDILTKPEFNFRILPIILLVLAATGIVVVAFDII
jgi:hypothetical protein